MSSEAARAGERMSAPTVAARRRPRLRHRVEYGLIRAVRSATAVLGEHVAGAIGAGLGRAAYRPIGIRREDVEEHLRLAFPDRDEAWVRRTAAASYAHLGREAIAMLRLGGTSARGVLERTRVEGLEALERALAAGRGVVLVTGHLGNWEIGGASLAARAIPIDVVVQRQSNPLFEAMLSSTRERLGMRVIGREEASRDALRSLRQGRLVAFVADQDGRESGVFVPFMGRPASTHRGPALLALRAGAPLFFGSAVRAPDGAYDVTLDPVEEARSGTTEEAVRSLTAGFTRRLERVARAHPGQYFWHHRRWKTRPRG